MFLIAMVVTGRSCVSPGGPDVEVELAGGRISGPGEWFGLPPAERWSAPATPAALAAVDRTRSPRWDGRVAGVVVGEGATFLALSQLGSGLDGGVVVRRAWDWRWWRLALGPAGPRVRGAELVLERWDEVTDAEARDVVFRLNPAGGLVAGPRPAQPELDLFAAVSPDGVILDLDPAFRLTPPAPLQGPLHLEGEAWAVSREVDGWRSARVGWAELSGRAPAPVRWVVDARGDTPLAMVAAAAHDATAADAVVQFELHTARGSTPLGPGRPRRMYTLRVAPTGHVSMDRGEERVARACLADDCVADALALAAEAPPGSGFVLSAPELTVEQAWPLLSGLKPMLFAPDRRVAPVPGHTYGAAPRGR